MAKYIVGKDWQLETEKGLGIFAIKDHQPGLMLPYGGIELLKRAWSMNMNELKRQKREAWVDELGGIETTTQYLIDLINY